MFNPLMYGESFEDREITLGVMNKEEREFIEHVVANAHQKHFLISLNHKCNSISFEVHHSSEDTHRKIDVIVPSFFLYAISNLVDEEVKNIRLEHKQQKEGLIAIHSLSEEIYKKYFHDE